MVATVTLDLDIKVDVYDQFHNDLNFEVIKNEEDNVLNVIVQVPDVCPIDVWQVLEFVTNENSLDELLRVACNRGLVFTTNHVLAYLANYRSELYQDVLEGASLQAISTQA